MTAPDEELRLSGVEGEFPALVGPEAPVAYLDNAATTQKPRSVIEAISRAYGDGCANVHRGAHRFADRASLAFESARGRVASFLGAQSSDEVVWTSGCTASLNLLALSLGDLGPDHEVLVSTAEHHSNLLPWRALCRRTGARLREIPVTDRGEISLPAYAELLGPRTRLVAVSHVSNVLGTVNPVEVITRMAHDVGALVAVDGAQAVARMAVDVRSIDCDFYAFSGHKLYGPFGIGVLYGKRDRLDALSPRILGGGMALEVSFEAATFVEPPRRFEAGTPNVVGAIALARAIDFLSSLGLEAVERHDRALVQRARRALREVDGVRLIGDADDAIGVVTFVHPDVHPHDMSTVCDQRGVAIRAGHHCAQPLMRRFGLEAAARASFSVYNRAADVDALVESVREAVRIFCP